MERVAIIGAGITGMTALRGLSSHRFDVRVFDKGRRRGGRIATRSTRQGSFDHGAPQIDVTSPEFDAFLTGLGAIKGTSGRAYGAPGMRSVFDGYDDDPRLRQGVRIAQIQKEHQGWVLRDDANRSFAHFDRLVLTVPAPQARDLLTGVDDHLASEVGKVRMHPVWTCMVSFERALKGFELPLGSPVLRADHMGRKPSRDRQDESWVIHMTPDFTRANLNADATMAAPLLLETFAESAGLALPGITYLNAHLWRYAFVDAPLGQPHLTSEIHEGLCVGGDWTLGRDAEHGFWSGAAIANSILSPKLSPV